MPTIITHSFIAGAFGKIYATNKMPFHFWLLSIVCSCLPDADVIGFSYGIKYSDMLGHRGFSHSLTFAFIISL